MARTRLAVQKKAVKSKAATTVMDWHKLALRVIAKSKVVGDDRRVRAVEKAIKDNQIAKCLKRMSILNEVDLDRELLRTSK